MPGFHHDIGIEILAFIVGFMSVARTARLTTYDDFPPVAWLRERWLARYSTESKWSGLVVCPFCQAPYLAAGMFAWAYFSDLAWWWWVPNVWWAASYLAAIMVAYDEPPD